MKEFLKIGLFVIATSIFFAACATKPIPKNVEKPKTKPTITDVLNNSFVYDPNQKLYRTKSPISTPEESNTLFSKFANFCSERNGKLVFTTYFINRYYANAFTNNLVNACEIDNQPYFIIHRANENSNIHYSVSMDEGIKRIYLSKKQPEYEKPTPESTEQSLQERKEIQRRESAREQKTKILLGKKDQKTMTFFNSWRYSGSEALCSKKCTDINQRTTGFRTLKDALSNNWQLVSKGDDIEEAIDDNCTCSGSSVLVKK